MKNILKILILEDEKKIIERFAKSIKRKNNLVLVASSNSACEAINLTKTAKPEIVILDLELHEGSGTGLDYLKRLNEECEFKPYLIVTTNNTSKIIYDTVRELGVGFIFSKHQKDYTEENVIDFIDAISDKVKLNPEEAEIPILSSKSELVDKLIENEFKAIGLSVRYSGYEYLKEIIHIQVMSDSHYEINKIAKKHNKSRQAIERAIQTAIANAWNKSDPEDLLKNFTDYIAPERGQPTNLQFVFYYSKKIKNMI